MVDALAPPEAPRVPPPRRRWRVALVMVPVAVVAVTALLTGVLVIGHVIGGRSVPKFPSLAEQPDSSLRGTIAYFAGEPGCVRLVAAAGTPSKDVLCIPSADMSKALELGTKENGPQLVWLADGRLEVTMFRSDPKTGTFSAGWQKLVDVRTGQVQDVPGEDVPSTPNLTTRPTVNPSGQRITTASDALSGRIKVMLTEGAETRTLLSARGPGEYTYGLTAAFWAPNWQWIAADDGRILVITPDDPPIARVLTDQTQSGRGRGEGLSGDDPRLASFAVTDADLLTASN